jgi:hypothetical protein
MNAEQAFHPSPVPRLRSAKDYPASSILHRPRPIVNRPFPTFHLPFFQPSIVSLQLSTDCI